MSRTEPSDLSGPSGAASLESGIVTSGIGTPVTPEDASVLIGAVPEERLSAVI